MSSEEVDFTDFDPAEDLKGDAAEAYNGTGGEQTDGAAAETVEGFDEQAKDDEAVAGESIDWTAVWDACNLSHDSGLSPTQLAGAIEVADETGGATRQDQDRLCQEALDADALHVRRSVAHTDDDNHELVVSEFLLPPEVRDE